MLKRLCGVYGRDRVDGSYRFNVEINLRVEDVLAAEIALNDEIAKALSGECVLHGDEEYVCGYTYITHDTDELPLINFIRWYLEGCIFCFELT